MKEQTSHEKATLIQYLKEYYNEISELGKYPKTLMCINNTLVEIEKNNFLKAAKELEEARKELPFGKYEEIDAFQNGLLSAGFREVMQYRQIQKNVFVIDTPPVDGVTIMFKSIKIVDGQVQTDFEVIDKKELSEYYYGFTEMVIRDIVEKVVDNHVKKKAQEEQQEVENEPDPVVKATPKIIL